MSHLFFLLDFVSFRIKEKELMTMKNEWQEAKNKIASLEGQQELVQEQLTKHQTQLEGHFSTFLLFLPPHKVTI
jgi:hypothetical protein